MRVPKIGPVKGYFSCDKVRPENCKKKEEKKGYLTFHPEISLKKGVVFLSLSLWMPEKIKRGVIKKNYRGYIEQCFGFRGVSKAGKARERGVQKFCQSGDRGGGVLSKGGNKHICVP